jgi:hypothetical protein
MWCGGQALPVVQDSGSGDGYDGEEAVEAFVVVGVGGEEGEFFGDGDGGDHEVGDPTAGFAAGADDGCADSAVCGRDSDQRTTISAMSMATKTI